MRAPLYRIHGLLVESEIALHGCEVERDADARGIERAWDSAADPAPDYRILEGGPRDCPRSPPPGRLLAERLDDGFEHWTVETRLDPGCWTLRYAGICEATLDHGTRTIVIHRAPEADPALIPIFLEGNVLAHALAADGRLALHASAVEVGGRALAIAGPSGTGKSTTAALLCAAGANLLADDVLRVDVTQSGVTCFPGSRGVRLRPAAASLAGAMGGAVAENTADGRTKVHPTRAADVPVELAGLVVPAPAREARRLDVVALGAMEGLHELLRHPRLTWWQAPELIGSLFELTAELAPRLPVYRARIPWGPPFPPELAGELLASVDLHAAQGPDPVAGSNQRGA